MNIFLQISQRLKNLFPYLLLISIYFFFVNIEARKEQLRTKEIHKTLKIKNESENQIQKLSNTELKVNIPVVPYKK